MVQDIIDTDTFIKFGKILNTQISLSSPDFRFDKENEWSIYSLLGAYALVSVEADKRPDDPSTGDVEESIRGCCFVAQFSFSPG